MAILDLVIAPDPRLKTKSSPVESIDEDIKQLALNMLETMYYERGIGLAAVQVGVMKRVLVADVEWSEDADGNAVPGTQYILINPEILQNSDEKNVYKEGCLSFPEQFAEVERPKEVRVKFQTLSGEWKEEGFTGLLATCIQHEIDHLNGITFPDRISPMRRDMILRKMKKVKKAWEDHHHHHVHDENCNH